MTKNRPKHKFFKNQDPIKMARGNLGMNTTRDGLFDDEHHRFVHQLRWKVNELNNTDKKLYDDTQIFYDKQGFKGKLIEMGIKTAETYAFAHKIEHIEPMLEKINDFDEFVLKPNHQSIGKNILVLKRLPEDGGFIFEDISGDKYNLETLREHIEFILTKTDPYFRGVILEERIRSHPDFNQWNPYADTITDLRLYCVFHTIPFAKLRVPTKESHGLGNTWQGASAFFVDGDGEIKDINYFRNTVRVHPDTKVSLIGEQIPFWEDICRISTKVSLRFKLPFHSVDLTVDEAGDVCVIESERIPLLSHLNRTSCEFLLNLMKKYSGSY